MGCSNSNVIESEPLSLSYLSREKDHKKSKQFENLSEKSIKNGLDYDKMNEEIMKNMGIYDFNQDDNIKNEKLYNDEVEKSSTIKNSNDLNFLSVLSNKSNSQIMLYKNNEELIQKVNINSSYITYCIILNKKLLCIASSDYLIKIFSFSSGNLINISFLYEIKDSLNYKSYSDFIMDLNVERSNSISNIILVKYAFTKICIYELDYNSSVKVCEFQESENIMNLIKLKDSKICGSFNSELKIWCQQTGKLTCKISIKFSFVLKTLYIKENFIIVSDKSFRPKLVNLKNFDNCEIICSYSGHYLKINCLIILNNSFVLSGSDDGSIKLWKLIFQKTNKTVDCEKIFNLDEVKDREVNPVKILKIINEIYFLAGYEDSRVVLWSFKNIKQIKEFNSNITRNKTPVSLIEIFNSSLLIAFKSSREIFVSSNFEFIMDENKNHKFKNCSDRYVLLKEGVGEIKSIFII